MSSNVSHWGAAAGPGPQQAPPPRVLLVSDDAEERALIRALLDEAVRAGMPLGEVSLDSAGDYRQAVLLAADFDYIAVLLGRVGPAADGTPLLRRAVAGRELPDPFLVLAERAEPAAVQAAFAAGAADMLDKRELTAATLERAVRYALALHRAETRAAGLELFDPATGLARQPLFWEVLSLAVRRAKRNKDFLALLMLHIDCLEQPTGKPGVDPMAIAVPLIAQRVVRVLRASDTVARLDDGHIAILVEAMPRAEDIQIVAEKTIAAAAGRYEVDGRIFVVTVNVGISLFPTSATDAGGMLRSAAVATLAARDKGVDAFHFG
jgi:diguanylate cyclase (GGDEF)-like protein